MKKNLSIRILAALGGVTLVFIALGMLAETFFSLPMTAAMGKLLGTHSPVAVLLTLLLAIVLVIFGLCGVIAPFCKRKVKHTGFVMQKGENGMIGVSVRSIEGLVQTCIKQHEVVAKADISVAERRDGIVILLDIEEAAGVNIPLSVGALQKQIKQYVNACTGVDVQEVRVLVENTDGEIAASPYAVQRPVMQQLAAPVETAAAEIPAAVPAQAPVEEPTPATMLEAPAAEAENALPEEPAQAPAEAEAVPAPQPVAPAMPLIPELPEEEDDRPLHQRLFGATEEPVFVAMPPELVVEPAAEETAEEAPSEGDEAPAEEAAASEEAIDANAVLEVVAAMAEDAAQPDEDPVEEPDRKDQEPQIEA